jgi:MFS superfamily sulfate permease-like transporter
MVVGLLESLMTATIVDDLTDTPSDKNRECVGQGVPTSPPASSAAWRAAR